MAARCRNRIPTAPPTGSLADDEVDRSHVDGLRFTLALRGYRMDEVDEVLDQLVDELDRRGERIRELEEHGDAGGTTAAQPDGRRTASTGRSPWTPPTSPPPWTPPTYPPPSPPT